MAAKKTSVGAVAGPVALLVAGVVGVFLVYRWLANAKGAQAATGPGGIYSGGGYSPYGQYGQPSNGGLLSSLLSKLGLGSGSSGRSGGGSTGGVGTNGGAPSSGVANYGQSWNGFYNAVQNSFSNDFFASNPELGGDSLVGYEPDLAAQSGLDGYQIPDPGYSPGLWDVSQNAGPSQDGWSQQDYSDNGPGGWAGTTTYGGDYGIDGGDGGGDYGADDDLGD